jgi:hypothetical protein
VILRSHQSTRLSKHGLGLLAGIAAAGREETFVQQTLFSEDSRVTKRFSHVVPFLCGVYGIGICHARSGVRRSRCDITTRLCICDILEW